MKSLGDFPFEYSFTRKRVKYLSIRITGLNMVSISAPMRMPVAYIIEFVKKKTPRILELFEKSKAEKYDVQPGNRIELLGEFYKVEKLLSDDEPVYDEKTKTIFLVTPIDSPEKRKWLYKKFADTLLPLMVENASREMGLKYANVYIKFQKSRWGSCTAEKNIYLNAALIRTPKPIIRYVIIHELAHLVHMNHQKPFWELVETYCPEYRLLRRFLRTNGNRLLMI